jgi:hypothetical protein
MKRYRQKNQEVGIKRQKKNHLFMNQNLLQNSLV